MDMYHSPEPGPTRSSALDRRDWKASLPVLAIAVSAWTMLSVWSVGFVAHAILAAGVVPSDTPQWQVFGLAAGLQACVGLLGLLSPLFFRSFKPIDAGLWVLCLAASLTVVGFETYHATFRAFQLSTGVSFEQAEAAELERMGQELSNLGQQVTLDYQDKLKVLDKAITNARDGRDRTGQPGCGPICIERTELYEQAQRRYIHLGRNAVPPATDKGDLRARAIDSRHRFAKLKAAEASLADFFRAIDGSAPPRQTTDAIARLGEALAAKEREYVGVSTIDAKSIAMVRTVEALSDILAGKAPRQDAWLPIAYGALPSLAITVLGIFIRLILETRRQPAELVDLHRELATEQQAAPLLRKLAQLRSGNFLQLLRAGFRRWDLYWPRQATKGRQRPREPAAGDD